MNKLSQLREQRNSKSKEANALNAKYPADQRMQTSDSDKLDALLAEIEAIDADIHRENRLIQLAADTDPSQSATLLNAITRDPVHHSDESKALRAFLKGGISAMADGDRNRMLARQTPEIRNSFSSVVQTDGGFTVAPEYMRNLETAMKAYGGMREAATIIRMTSGAQMTFPTTDPTAEEGEIVGQNVLTNETSETFGALFLDVFKYSSKSLPVPFELIQDSFIDIEAYLNEIMAMRLGRITNRHYTLGTGTNQPRGIVTSATAGKIGATGQTASITYDDLIDLEHSVDRAYRSMPGTGFMMADATLKVIRKIKDGQGRPIFNPGYETGVPAGAPDTLLGRPIVINQHMEEMAPNAKSVLFGAFRKYIIRDIMDLTLFRMTDSAYTLRGQVGFAAFMRSGGNLIDVGGAVKYYQNAAS